MKKNLSFYLTGSILTAITVMLLVGAVTVSGSLYHCFDAYFAETKIEAEDEILLTYRYAKANGIAVGDTMELAGITFRVCGLGMKPDYAIMLREFPDSVPDKDGFGIGILSKEAIKSLGAGMEYYSIRYGDKEKETAFRTEIYEKYGTVEYVEQKANTRISLIY